MVDIFFFPQQPPLSKTRHLHMQCISLRILTVTYEPWDLSDRDTLQDLRNEDACLMQPPP